MTTVEGWPEGAPGSDEALARGCQCPVLDNAHGKGRLRRGRVEWWQVADCPVAQHGGQG